MRVSVSEDTVEVILARWEKVLGLMGNISVRRIDIEKVRIVDEPIKEVMRSGLKAGLRIPWLYYVCRTIRLDQVFLVRRGVPGLSFSVRGEGTLKRVLLSTGAAEELFRELTASD